ncbi:MAG: FecR domain-containing protein [Deltaproteobacteria bacterium]|nr:FecR domain-containing protein [Deltaproteobacteria bacterium]
MADLAKDLAEAREHVAPRWTPERARRVRLAVEERARRPDRRARAVALIAATAAVLAAVFYFGGGRELSPIPVQAVAPREASPAAEPRVLFALADGTVVTALSADARVEPMGVEPRAVTVRLAQGAARFSVTPNPDRQLRVISGDTVTTVLGTVFEVSRRTEGVHVRVERGRVRVSFPGGERELGAGESLLSPDAKTPPAEATSRPEPAEPLPPRAVARSASPSWRSLAKDGSYARALAGILPTGAEAVRDDPADLLLAADVARLGGEPERAVKWLSRVIEGHAADSRAALAAFTLGRTLLDQLGRPREAAVAFAQARKLGGGGALAEDALAREVECWSRAGEATLARERGLEYLGRFPNGRRLAAVKKLAEVD